MRYGGVSDKAPAFAVSFFEKGEKRNVIAAKAARSHLSTFLGRARRLRIRETALAPEGLYPASGMARSGRFAYALPTHVSTAFLRCKIG